MPIVRLRLVLLVTLMAAGGLLSHSPVEAQSAAAALSVDASAPIPAPETGYLHMGGTSSGGFLGVRSLQVNSQYLTLDGKPWLPVMGEMHYSRVPRAEWEDEILKMKAGGVNIVSTYIFWIHHEEVEGQFDWSGQRDLRAFVELCAKHGMYVWLRPGPWAHGEVRNGGFPDWLMKLPKLRTTDPGYIAHVATLYNEIGKQVHGLMFQDGGPVIGAQLENEYGQHGTGRGAEYISKLKEVALAAGIDPPLFSVTGWPSLDFPPHDVMPVGGGYPDGFWYTAKGNLPPSGTYAFNFHRELGDMGANQKNENADGKVDMKHFPNFAAEEGGGMALAYHRRPLMDADDIAASTLAGVGSGVNLYGYYMYHGGANPTGKLTTLQESRATNYPNDLTEITYDFQAPLGEFGQERESYRKTRLIHLFLNAYGPVLAPMPTFQPSVVPKGFGDNTVARVAVRSNGDAGFLFVNNYVRQMDMPARPGLQVSVKLASGEMMVPAKPIDVASGAYFILPFNLTLDGVKLKTATAQLLTRLTTPKGPITVFFAIPGVTPELVFDAATVKAVDIANTTGTVLRKGPVWTVDGLTAGLNTTVELTDAQGKKSTILLLTEAQAEQTEVLHVKGSTYLAMSGSDEFFDAADGDTLHLLSTQSPKQEVSLMPALSAADVAAKGSAKGRPDGLWTRYTFEQPASKLTLTATMVRKASPRAEMAMSEVPAGKKGPAFPVIPTAADFDGAAEWQIRIASPGSAAKAVPDMHGLSELMVQFDYTGDFAHLREGKTLLDDNFYNGTPWQVGLKRFGADVFKTPLALDILPLPADAPVYLDARARALAAAHGPSPQLIRATLVPQYETLVRLSPSSVA